MPEHVPLLMTMPAVGDPSVVMKVVKERFSRLLRKREVVSDRVWQKRFYDFNVCTDRKRVEKLRYSGPPTSAGFALGGVTRCTEIR